MKQDTVSEHEKAVNRVVDYINSHLYESPDIRTLAEVANISGFHFHRIFKTIIGENIGEFVNRLRLEDIALRLLMSKDSLTDICIQTGYGTKHALSRAFKIHFGISPSIYRSQPRDLHPFFGNEKRKEVDLVPEIRTLGKKTIVYIRIIGVYGEQKAYRYAWNKLGDFAKTNRLVDKNTEYIGLSFDDPSITTPTRCRFYACFTPNRDVTPDGAFGVRQIQGGKYAVFLHRGAYCNLKDTYYNIYIKWIPLSGWKIRGSMSFEKYLNSEYTISEEDLLTEIYIPIGK